MAQLFRIVWIIEIRQTILKTLFRLCDVGHRANRALLRVSGEGNMRFMSPEKGAAENTEENTERAIPALYDLAASATMRMLMGFSRDIHYKMKRPLETNRVLARVVKISDSDRVLDAGCGQGSSVLWLLCNSFCAVDAVTVSRGEYLSVLRLIKDKVSSKERHVSVFQENMLHTHFSPGTFTVVWAVESVCHVDQKAAFLKEAKRVLAAGGRLVILDFFMTDGMKTAKEMRNFGYFCEGFLFPSLTTRQGFVDLLQEAGFRNVRYEALEHTIRSSIIEREISGWLGVALLYPLISLKILPKVFFFKNSQACIAQGTLFRNKKLSYCAIYAEV